MVIRRPPAFWLLAPSVVLICSGLSCPLPLGSFTGTTTSSTGATEILLRIINRSGLAAEVDATFYVGSTAVRETTRLLPAQGAESTSLVVPTNTELIHIVARQADAESPAARAGDILADEEIRIGPDASPGDSITFIISLPVFIDCNANGVNDVVDIVTGTSADCNLNEIPDECESPTAMVVLVGEIGAIIATDQDGTAPTPLVDLGSYGLGSLRKIDMDVAGGHIYFTQIVSVSDGTVHRIPLGGGTPMQLISNQDTIGGIGLDVANGRMYWTSYITSPAGVRIASALLDGSTTANVITGLSGPVAKPFADAPNRKLYFTYNPAAGSYDYIEQSDLDGTNITGLITYATDPRDVEVWPAAGLMVWAEYGAAGGIFTADLHGNNALKIATVPKATGVAIDRYNCKIYWTSEGTLGSNNGYIERANFDGSGIVRILSNVDGPQDVAVYPAP